MRLPAGKGGPGVANDVDPREVEEAEVIDLASRNAFPAVTQRKGLSDGAGLAAGVAAVGLIGAVVLWSMNSARLDPPQGVGGQQVAQGAAVPPPVPEAAITPTPQNAQAAVMPQADPAPSPVLAAQPGAFAQAAGNPYASPTVVYDASSVASPAGGTFAPPAQPGEAAAQSVGGGAGDFASRIGGVGGGTATARPMVDPTTTVTQGTLIPAILETAINTDVPGYVRAVVSQDVRSFDGKSVLVPRSSRLIGQYQSGVQ
ncbi:MAG: type VI secretion protein, partial [Erythrobacter sp. 34-65-8]